MKVVSGIIEDYVCFADKYYQSQICKKDFSSSCHNDCIQCLDNQNHKGIARKYDCEKRCGAYLCHYIFRHVMEMCCLAHSIKNLPEAIKVLSIGCGPCSELISLEHEISQIQQNHCIDYLGIDMSEKWRPFHLELPNLMLKHNKNVSAKFVYKDIVNTMEELKEESFDIVVFNYFLSDFKSLNNNSMIPVRNLCSILNDYVFSKMPEDSYILINDINHNVKARDSFDALIRAISRHKIVFKYRFKKPENVLQEYTQSYINRGDCPWKLPAYSREGRFEAEYSPRTDCASAQVLIQLK